MKKVYGTIYTMNRDMPCVEAMVIDRGKIVFAGSRDEADNLYSCETLNYTGKTILPGFIDSHVHVLPSGLFMKGVDLSGAKNIPQIQSLLKDRAEVTPAGEWILGAFFQDKLIEEKRFPNRYELDKAAPDNPVFICHNDVHPFSFNSAALELLQLDPQQEGICTDENGVLNGLVEDPSCMSMYNHIYSFFSDDMLLEGCKTLDDYAVSNGVTTIFGKDVLRVLKLREAHADELKAEFVPMWMSDGCDDWEGFNELIADETLKSKTCVCTFADGAFDGYSASVIEPYENRPTDFGILLNTNEKLYKFAKAARDNDMQFSVHAIGDHAIEQVIDVYEQVLADAPKKDHRFRIEHFELPTKQSIKKAAELNIALGMQPLLIEICEGMDLSGYSCFIGDRAAQCSPYRSILDEGLLVGGGTDYPVTPMKPLHGARISMTQPVESERITLMECLEMNTVNAAKLGFLEDRKGMIKEGLEADFIVLDANPFEVSTEQLSDIDVEKTYRKGELVYSK